MSTKHLSYLDSTTGIINSVFYGGLIVAGFVLLSTELLSSLNCLNFAGIFAAWAVFSVVSVFVFIRHGLHKFKFGFNRSYLLLFPVFFILLVTLFTALVYPSNNWDSMTYHMPRIMHWIDNGSVEFYKTHESRQLYQPPFAEYAIMHLQVLTDADYLANTVQWLSFVFCIITVVLLVFEITQNQNIAMLAIVITATIPMAILQSSSTQNDLAVSGFTASFALLLIRLSKAITIRNIVFAGIALGLAIATKGTALIYCLAIGVSFAVPMLYRLRQKTVLPLMTIVLIGFVINGFFFYRTYQKYGNIIPVSETALYKNTGNPIKNTYQNAIRNIMFHSPDLGYEGNKYIYRASRYLLLDDMNNLNNTWEGVHYTQQNNRRHEDFAGNRLHMILIICALVFVCKSRKDVSVPLVFSIVSGFVLYCLILKWQPWGSRLQLPLFVLACPVIASFIYNAFDARARVLIAGVLIVFATPYLFKNETRNLASLDWLSKSRNELMFNSNPQIYKKYSAIAGIEKSKPGKYMDIRLTVDQYEYPLWVMSGKQIK